METRVTTGTFAAIACSVVLVYAAPQKARPDTTTITGCLERGPSPRSVVLTQVPGGSDYTLVADASTNLLTMVGREVEVTGSAEARRFAVKEARLTGSSC